VLDRFMTGRGTSPPPSDENEPSFAVESKINLILLVGTRVANEFSWFPIVEVARLLAGIFMTIIPAIAILRARAGADHRRCHPRRRAGRYNALLGGRHPPELPQQRPDLSGVLRHRRR
jgi:Putative citrate transport